MYGTLFVTWFQKISRIWCLEDACSSFYQQDFFCWDTLLLFLFLLNISTILSVVFNTLFTLCHFETKRGSIFLFLDRFFYFSLVKWFLSQNGQMGSLLVYELHYVDKNTTILGYCWNKIAVIQIIFFRDNSEYILQYGKGLIWQVQCHKYQERQFSEVKEDSDAFTAQERFPLWPSKWPEEASERPPVFEQVSEQLSRQPSGHLDTRAHVHTGVWTANWRLGTVKTACNRPNALLKTSEEKCVSWSRLLLDVQTSFVLVWTPPRESEICVKLGFPKPI